MKKKVFKLSSKLTYTVYTPFNEESDFGDLVSVIEDFLNYLHVSHKHEYIYDKNKYLIEPSHRKTQLVFEVETILTYLPGAYYFSMIIQGLGGVRLQNIEVSDYSYSFYIKEVNTTDS